MDRFENHYRFWNAVLLLGMLVVCLLLWTARATNNGIQLWLSDRPLPPICPYKARAGIDCPTCGLTRSCITLLQGDYTRSVEFHPYGRLVIAFIAVQLLLRTSLLLPGGHRFWKWDVAITSVLIAVCFGPFLWLS